ncbi:MAG: VWA domain-containing protein, partial [Chloroflexi bacterium]|nr:VWA domain-containing protein [Chloroflexota bacterium]
MNGFNWLGTKILHPVKRRLTGCCLIIVLAALLACGGLFYLVTLALAQEPAPPQMEPPVSDPTAQEVLLLIDNSYSMYNKNGLGSDPDLLRIEAARLFITYLGVDSSGPVHRLGVIFFGGQAELTVPLTPLADDDRRAELAHLIANPPPLTWTNPQAALALAGQTFQTGLPASGPARRAVVLLTDGKPQWTNTPTAPQTTETLAWLRETAGHFAAQNIPIFVILLQNSATDADPEIEQLYVPLWQEMVASTPPGRFYRARHSQELLDIYHDIVVTLTGRQTAGPVINTQVQAETIEEVQIEAGLAQVTFVIRKSDPAIQVKIFRPDGQPLNLNTPEIQYAGRPGHSREEIWAAGNPLPGTWQVQLNGRGSVTVWQDFYPAPATPTFTPGPTPTFTPTPTPTPTPVPAVTPTLSPTPRPPTATASPSPSPQPISTVSPTPLLPSTTPLTTENVDGLSSALPLPLGWCLTLPLTALAVGGGGLWLRYGRTRPLLTGTLRQISAPAQVGRTRSPHLDLDILGRRQILLGPNANAYLHLPHTSNQTTPSIQLSAYLETDGQPGVNLKATEPKNSEPEPVQINNLPITGERALKDGDVITLGAYRFKYENLRQRTVAYGRRPGKN